MSSDHLQIPSESQTEQRATERRPVAVAARMTWKDASGTTRLATVETLNVSDTGVFVKCTSGSPIPLHRLVNFHIDRSAWSQGDLPSALRRAQVLAAIYRVGPFLKATGVPGSYALRLMVRPDRRRSLAARTATLKQAIRRCSVVAGGPRSVLPTVPMVASA